MLQRTIPRRISFLLSFLLPIVCVYAQQGTLQETLQGCDCEDAGQCLYTFGTDISEVCYEVSGLTQNELGNGQEVCGVNLYFRHGLIYNLDITLVSPNGTEIQLIGEPFQLNDDEFGTTGNVEWDLLFVPASQIAQPDTVTGITGNQVQLADTWSNNQEFPGAGDVEGSYYPVDALGLEGFNSGPANGVWCLNIDNSLSDYPGQIFNFEVIFCDIGGLPCCIADAGELEYDFDTVSGCEGDESLNLDVDVLFQDGAPDSTYYDYTFLFSDDQGLIQGFNDSTDLSALSPGDYTICGLSYLIADSSYLDSLVGIWNIDTLGVALDNSELVFCADLTDDCFMYTVEVPPIEYDSTVVICPGESFMIDDSTFTESGMYTIVYENPTGCDAVGYLDLTVELTDTTELDSIICFGDTLDFYGQLLTSSGLYEHPILSTFGCTSIVKMDLTILDEELLVLTETICEGEQYALGSSIYTASGNYVEILPGSNGACDTTVELELIVDTLDAIILGPLVLSCSEPSLSLDGSSSMYNGSDTLSYLWSTTGGMIDSDPTQPLIDISQSGTYTLEISSSTCTDIETVVVIDDVGLPVIDVDDIDDLTCSVTQVDIDASNSTFANSGSFSWSVDSGNIVSGENGPILTVDMEGTYILTLIDGINGCESQDTFQVGINNTFPFASAGPDMELNCAVDELDLYGKDSDYLGPYYIFWEDGNGNMIAGSEGELELEVNTVGTYTIVVENTVNNCISTDDVIVTLNNTPPVADIGMDLLINCQNPQAVIDGSTGSTVLNNFLIEWETPSNGIASGANSLNPLIQEPGEYILTYTNLDNFCSDADTLIVFGDFVYENVNAGEDQVLDCQDDIYDLGTSSDNPTGVNFEYNWFDQDGVLVESSQVYTVDAAGIYTMQVLNTDNGCVSLDEVEITSIQREIIVSANTPDLLTCFTTSVDLEGSYTDVIPGETLSYNWISPEGDTISQIPTVSVEQDGIYTFTVTDESNFCFGSVEVEVEKDVNLPDPDAGVDIALDCETGLATLSGNYTALPGVSYTSNWSTIDGNIISSTSTTAEVDKEALYYFEVTNQNTGCTFQDVVYVFIDVDACTPIIIDVPDVLLTCYTYPNDFIDASNAFVQGPNIEFEWEVIEGIFVSGSNTLVPDAVVGTYILRVTNTTFNLVAEEIVNVIDNRVYPIAQIQNGSFTADCDEFENTIELIGAGSSVGPEYIYEWELSLPEGEIVSGQDEINCFIDQPGLYQLTVTDTVNGCSVVSVVSVGLEGSYPTLCLDEFAQFDCDFPSITISDDCALSNYELLWQINQGEIMDDSTSASVDVSIFNSPEPLYLSATDPSNGCTTTDTILIFGEGQCFPECNVDVPDVITCTNGSVDLVASTNADNASYEWTVNGVGAFCDQDTLSPIVCVNADGLYNLVITNLDNGLSCSTTIEVFENLSVPLGSVQPIDSITCKTDSVSIHIDVFGTEDFTVEWLAPGLNCEPSEFADTIYFVDCPGQYELVLTSSETGCKDSIEVNVPMDMEEPTVSLSTTDILDCSDPSLTLLSTGSVTGESYVYTYYDPNDNIILTGQDIPIVPAYTSGEYCLHIEDLTNGCVGIDCYDVVDNGYILDATTGSYDPLDCENPNVIISGTASDDFDNLIFSWTSDDGCFVGDPNQDSVLIDCPGEYTFIAFDPVTFCSDEVTVIIDQDSSLPLADAGPDVEFNCSDTLVTLDGTDSDVVGDLVYSWFTPDGNIVSNAATLSPQVDLIGTYNLVVTDVSTACSDTSQVEVISGEDFPIADAGPDGVLGCYNSVFQVVDNEPSIGDSISYSWQVVTTGTIESGENSPNPVFSEEGYYELIVTDISNGCSSVDTMELVEDKTKPVAVIDAQSNFFNCFYEEINMTGLDSEPSGELSYFWDTEEGLIDGDNEQANITALQGGTYTLIVTNLVNGCDDQIDIVLDYIYSEPDLAYELPDELNCKNEFVILDATASSSLNGILPSWSGPISANIINPNSLNPSVDLAGKYTLIVRDALSLCGDTIDFNVFDDYEQPTAVLSSEPIILCEINDAVLDLSASMPIGQSDFEWTYDGDLFNTQDSIVEVGQEGDYLAVVTDVNNGCKDSLMINVYSEGIPIDSVDLLISDPLCFGSNTGELEVGPVYGGSGPYMYSIDDSDFASHIYYQYLAPGEYMFTVEDIDGCRLEQLVEIIEPDPVLVDLGEDLYIRYGEVADMNAEVVSDAPIISVNWDKPVDDTCSNCLKASVSPDVTTDYTIYVRNADNCLGSDDLTVFVDETPGIYVPNTFSPGIGNANGVFIPYGDESIAIVEQLNIFDRWGELVFQNNNFNVNDISQGWNGEFNGKLLQPGVFTWIMMVRLENGELIQMEGSLTLVK